MKAIQKANETLRDLLIDEALKQAKKNTLTREDLISIYQCGLNLGIEKGKRSQQEMDEYKQFLRNAG